MRSTSQLIRRLLNKKLVIAGLISLPIAIAILMALVSYVGGEGSMTEIQLLQFQVEGLAYAMLITVGALIIFVRLYFHNKRDQETQRKIAELEQFEARFRLYEGQVDETILAKKVRREPEA